MKGKSPKNQSGFTLLVFVLALMTAGGLLLIGVSHGMLESAENTKFEHNKRVLEEAKRALLQYAYNYPVNSNNLTGPGRLPNADDNNDGTSDGGSTFGRLPWNQPNLNLYDIRDADGQRLWYGVSSSFRPQATIVNSDTSGTMTLRDQQGNVIYDGANSGAETQYGIAAVIIAPGAIMDRNGVTQDRSLIDDVSAFDTIADDDPGIVLASNYLDLVVGTEDNASFTNSSATDGFILGPVYDSSNDVYLTNDQFIVITAAEVAEMAEKSAMQAYRTAIENYRLDTSYCEGETPDGAATEAACLAAATPGTWTLGPYPWLYNYAGVTDIADMSSYYPANANWATEEATNLTTIGRIPTMFGDYFTETNSKLFETELIGSVGITIPQDIACSGCDKAFTYNNDEYKFNDFATVKTPIFETGQILTDVQFVDSVANDGEGRLTGNAASAVSATLTLLFWDLDHGETEIYTPCPDDGDGIPEFTDCARDYSNNPIPGQTTEMDLALLRIEVSLDFPYSSGVVDIDMDYSTPPTITFTPATATSHAIISATFADTDIIAGMPTISGGDWYFAEHYHDGDTTIDWNDSGTLDSSGFVIDDTLTLGVRYFPEVPAWAFTNDWHNSMILHYARGYEPGGTQTCNPLVFDADTSCIFIRMRDFSATEPWNRDKIAVLLNTAEHGWVDGNSDGDFEDHGDRDSVTDAGNREFDYIMRWKDPGDPDSGDAWEVPPGNDNLLILEEQ